MKNLNEENVIKFGHDLADKLNVKLVTPGSRDYKQFIQALRTVSKCSARKAEERMKAFSMSLPGLIWLSFELGKVSGSRQRYQLNGQVGTIVHEGTHAHRRQHNPLFDIRYVTQKAFQASEECWSLRAEMESYYMHGYTPDINKMVESLRAGYTMRGVDRKVVLERLKRHKRHAAAGRVSTPVGKFARKWWEK